MPRQAARPPMQDALELLDLALKAAMAFVPGERANQLCAKWLLRRDRDFADLPEDRLLAMATDAVVLAEDLVVSQPNVSGITAFDRLARRRGHAPAAEAGAIQALCKARFHLLLVEEMPSTQAWLARDVTSDTVLRIAGPELPRLEPGTILFSRVVRLGDGTHYLAGAITPLDHAASTVARNHPAAGGRSHGAAARWAEAVYAHVVRHGTLRIAGVNAPISEADTPGAFEPGQEGELYELSLGWKALGAAAPDAALLQRTRQAADIPTILDGLAAAVLARDGGRIDVATAFERLLAVQLETVRRREANGAGALSLDAVARALNHNMQTLGWPARVRTLYETLRGQVNGGRLAEDPGLERLVQRIQALRAKTVAQGCTEQEALAAAEKVAALLDRHGLSLNALEFKAQPCEGIGIQTNRRRAAPIDACILAIAGFFDCRVWQERAEGAPLRYIFFGLRGDVAAAQYLYEMVERAFEIETDAFRASDLYIEMAGERRAAANSFQTGLAQGIAQKLHDLRAARDSARRSASGRDLVPVKAAMVDAELEKLGLSLTRRVLSRGKQVLTHAFTAGQVAGQRFEVTAGISKAA